MIADRMIPVFPWIFVGAVVAAVCNFMMSGSKGLIGGAIGGVLSWTWLTLTYVAYRKM